MRGSYFVPDTWDLSEKLLKWTKDQGLSDAQIQDQLDRFRDHEYPKPRKCFDRCWRRWIRNAIDWSKVTPTVAKEYRQPQELSQEQRSADILAFENDPLIRAARKGEQK